MLYHFSTATSRLVYPDPRFSPAGPIGGAYPYDGFSNTRSGGGGGGGAGVGASVGAGVASAAVGDGVVPGGGPGGGGAHSPFSHRLRSAGQFSHCSAPGV